MNKQRIRYFLLILSFFYSSTAKSLEANTDTSQLPAKEKKYSYWQSLIYGNLDRTFERKFDVSFIAAPSYTSEASIGIGGMATGLYRVNQKDSILPPSDVSLGGYVSISLFYTLFATGKHHFKDHHSQLTYDIEFNSKNLEFWGIDYSACRDNSMTKYKRQLLRIKADYTYMVLKHFYVGAYLNFTQTKIAKIEDISYLQGQNLEYLYTGLGLSVQYDSRYPVRQPQKGFYIMFRESIFPKGFGNCGNTYWNSTFIADFFQKLWKGSVLGIDLYANINSANSPWPMREELGGAYRMRGYYAGRFIDNNILSGQIELRQKIYKRLGCVAWVGTGNVFSSFKNLSISHFMISYGLGLRFEFKNRINIRIDYGFGKGTSGFVFGVGESF